MRELGFKTKFETPFYGPHCNIYYQGSNPYSVMFAEALIGCPRELIICCPNDEMIMFPVDLADPDCFDKLRDWIHANHETYRRRKIHKAD